MGSEEIGVGSGESICDRLISRVTTGWDRRLGHMSAYLHDCYAYLFRILALREYPSGELSMPDVCTHHEPHHPV